MTVSRPWDRRFIDLAIDLGRRGLGRTAPNPAVGAVLVRGGPDGPVIVGRGWTQPGGRPHAEIEAFKRAGEAARGATLYVSLEPCSHHGRSPPCADAIIAAGVARVVSAMEDPNPEVAGAGHARLRAHGIEVTVGVGADEARRAHAGHIRRMRDGRPHVMLKLAVSADGKAGGPGRTPVAITGEAAQACVHMLRAQSDAILVGIGTALADDPELTCRLPGLQSASPVRVVLDARLRLPRDGRLARTAREVPVWVVTLASAPKERKAALSDMGVDVFGVEGASGMLPPYSVLRLLADRGITRMMIEGGPTLAAAFVSADLVDEAVLFHAAKAIGVDGVDALAGLPLTALTASPHLVLSARENIGADTAEHFERD